MITLIIRLSQYDAADPLWEGKPRKIYEVGPVRHTGAIEWLKQKGFSLVKENLWTKVDEESWLRFEFSDPLGGGSTNHGARSFTAELVKCYDPSVCNVRSDQKK